MKRVILRSTLGLLLVFLVGIHTLVFADIPVPSFQSVWIETRQAYPDYDFYVASLRVTSTGAGVGRSWTKRYDTFALIPISLAAKKPFEIAPGLYRSDFSGTAELYLIAVNRNSGLEGTDVVKEQAINMVKGTGSKVFGQELDFRDIYSQSGDMYRSDRSRTYTIEGLDETGLRLSDSYGVPDRQDVSGISGSADAASSRLYIGLGLLVAGLMTLVGLLLVRRR